MSIEPNIEKLQYIFDNTKIGIAICNADDNHLEMVNSAFAHIHGYEPHELIGVAPGDVFAPECMLRLEAHESLPSCAINDISFETVHYKKDGSPVDIFVHITVVKDENGHVKHRIANIQDITEKKREENELQASEDKRKKIETQFTSLGSIIPDLIWMKDINGLYIDCNSAFESFFSTSKENILGKTDYDFFDKNAADFCKQTDIEAISTGTINISQETFIYPEDKTTGIMEIRKVPVLNDKKIVGVLGIGRDITNDIKHQQQLMKMEFFLKNIKESVFLITESGEFEYVNEEACRALGYTKEELLKFSVNDIDKEYNKDILSKHWEHVKTHGSLTFERLHVRKDGVCFPVEIHANYFLFENKSYNLAIVRDITKNREQEELLLKKEQAFRSLAENTPDNIARWDTEGRYLYINPVHEKTLGRTHSQALGTCIPETHTEVISAIKRISETGESVSFVRQSVLNEVGEIELHDVNLVPERDEFGNIISILGIGRNMTEIYRLQDELAARKEEFRTLTANSPDHVMRLDTQGRYLYLNPIHERTLGLPASEIIGRPKEELFPEHTAVLDAVERIVETGEEKITVIQPVPGENGKIEIHEVKLLAEKNSDGKIVSILGIGRDVTEHKQMEIELNTANKRYEEFFGNCADPCYLVEVTPDGRFVHLEINQAYIDAVEAPKEAIVGRYMDELEDAGFRDILTRKYSSCMSAKVGENVEFTGEYHLPKGIRTYHSVMTPIHGSDGSICRIAGIARDITEQKLAKEALHEREAFLDSLLNAIPIPVFYKDSNGIYLGVNRMYETYFGTTSEEFIGKSVFDIHPKELAEIYHAKDTEVFECRIDAQQYETQLKHMNGTLHDIIFSKAAFFDNQGHVKGLIGAILDITERKHSEEHLERTKAKLSAVISTIPDLIWVKDAEGIYMLCNPSFENFFGASCGEIIGKTDYDFIAKEQADFFRQKDREAMESGEMCINEEEIVFANNGQRALLETRKIPVYNGDEFMGVLGIGRDITKRKQMETELQNHADFHSTLVNAMFDVGMQLMVIENGKIIYIGNRELARGFGYTDAELDAQPSLLDIIHPDDKARVADTYMRRLAGEEMPNVYELGLITREGERREFETSITIVPNSDPVRIVTVGRDITERKTTENKIDYLAHHDVLTGLPNRILLKNKADIMIRSAKLNDSKVALLFIDLDEFKTINDTLGHLVGDKMLKVVSSRLQTIIKQDDIISRLGGDEFVILLQNINTYDEIISLAERIIKKFEQPYQIEENSLYTSASIGIALYPNNGNSFQSLLQNADTAMYKAKESGKNAYCFFTEEMKHNLIGEFKLKNDLKNALLNNEFVLHYQPQINRDDNSIIGVEALIRWQHPQLGMIPPNSFISIAESNGFIVEIGEWVIKEACRQAAIWNKQGMEIVIAVNISAIQFKRGNLQAVIQDALSQSGLDPKFLELELTESLLINDTENMLKSVHKIKKLGIQLSIDDFGTGYSSLAYLKRFAVDKLKIDRSFVKDIVTDHEDATIVKTIIQMAKNLNLRTIAEGVENHEVLEVLDSYGCDEIQGYHFSKPLEAALFESYYNQYNA